MQPNHDPETIEIIGSTLTQILTQYYQEKVDEPVLAYRTKSQIMAQFHCDEPPYEGRPLQEVIETFRSEILPLSVKTWHPGFLNQMFAGASYPSIIGDLLASMMNPTMATWEMSPVATLIEQNIAQWMAQLIGMPKGSGGIFLPGGTVSNLLALTVARNRYLSPEVRDRGLCHVPPGAIICSEASHYSIASAANLLGIGLDQVFRVPVNRRQEMDAGCLRQMIEHVRSKGLNPFAVVATTGVTVTGGFDPLAEIAAIVKDAQIHLHVDAAFGGGLAFSDRRSLHFSGIEHADTVSWDAHKWMHTPLTCSVLLVPDPTILEQTFSLKADYLFHPQQEDLLADLGKSTILCGKRFDALKIWLLWHTYGTQYFANLANERLAVMERLDHWIAADTEFHMDYRMVSPICCFTYTHEAMNQLDTEDRLNFSNQMHRSVREDVKHSGSALFNITKLNGRDQFRMVFINPLTDYEYLVGLMENIRARCRQYVNRHLG
ncbi:MAG: aminotransferase class V-fold PLP-dependent enzyme [Acidobacteria bacterium]|nr:aminotransferase class V-fold PLP-dependent enzyme [Acidobacteriota bacterium]